MKLSDREKQVLRVGYYNKINRLRELWKKHPQAIYRDGDMTWNIHDIPSWSTCVRHDNLTQASMNRMNECYAYLLLFDKNWNEMKNYDDNQTKI